MRDNYVKERLAQLPITLFCIHGNHEMRPGSIDSYKLITWKGGQAYIEDKYPNLVFAKDGEIYTLADRKVLVVGGAYSVDKWYAGHYHCDRTVDKLQIMYRNVELFCGDRDLKFSME